MEDNELFRWQTKQKYVGNRIRKRVGKLTMIMHVAVERYLDKNERQTATNAGRDLKQRIMKASCVIILPHKGQVKLYPIR